MLENVSYRYKIPVALTLAIVLTEVAVTAVLIAFMLSDARRNVESGAYNLANVTALSVRDSIVRDDLFHVFELLRAPVAAKEPANPLKALIVFDASGRVYAATDPRYYATLTEATSLGNAISHAVGSVKARPQTFYFSFPSLLGADDIIAAKAVRAEDGSPLGYVTITYDPQKLRDSVNTLVQRMVLVNIASLLVLVPIGWWWGKRMAKPLHTLSKAMTRVHKEDPEILKQEVTASGQDEIGRLSRSFREMMDDLAEKQQLERDMVVSERLAAVGRVAAGIAHEINNPLGGMMNAVDTLAMHGNPDGLTGRTLALLRRGLAQIRATVAALLFEARLDSPAMREADWDDLNILIQPQLAAKQVKLEWVMPTDEVPIPSHLVRQLVLNLLLNAIKAAESGGVVKCNAMMDSTELRITVQNSGEHIPADVVGQLFEPYWPSQKTHGPRSYGLGLWVSYQIATQLGGTISVNSVPGETTFEVALPIRSMETCHE
ncbi:MULTISPECIES: HAMP domain-containing sensor histidine kinase [Caballeronia]|uniref:histidine kinase n=1 Tax=Caballeronia novacaledonica TaxID=1544861 RepID=A0AA37I9Y9_9BURK|nr:MULTISPECIES: HAMP domain-containing sensor histidine kinase [Caballeronia]MDR5743574.1 HAMP domain-containing sensor histidine kinase [Caballeronia sp. LZ029]GJH25847.1 HAMP domain-containing protein [Caballeronia novacaledonica]